METKETLDLGELNVSGIDRRQVEQFLYTGRKEEVSGFVDDYFRKISNGSLQSVLLRQYVLMDLYVSAVSVLEKSGYTSENLLEQYKDAQKMEIFLGTAGQAREYIKNLFGAVIELREQGMERRYDNLIQHAKAYIEDNYNHEDISLNMVASEVNLSSSHFSTVFGQETGVTFVEYLTKVRMDKAKQLLRTTGTKTTEIAFEVGFRDAHYFSNLFKKTQGCTPREYRNRSDRPEQEQEKL
jgi:two-component system response regulator YesN